MAAPKKETHYFVVTPQGTSAHMKGAFASREIALEWVAKHRPHAPCWIVPAEYVGKVRHRPLDAEGQPVQEG